MEETLGLHRFACSFKHEYAQRGDVYDGARFYIYVFLCFTMGFSLMLVPFATLSGSPSNTLLEGALWPRSGPAACRVQCAVLVKLALARIGSTEGNSDLAGFSSLLCVKACANSQSHRRLNGERTQHMSLRRSGYALRASSISSAVPSSHFLFLHVAPP